MPALRFCRALYLMIQAAALALGGVSSARAQQMEPPSYTNAPVGLNFLMVGYGYLWGDVLLDPSLPIKGVDAKVSTAFLTYSRILDFWGQSGSLALVVPYAWLSASGEVAGESRVRRLWRTGGNGRSHHLTVRFTARLPTSGIGREAPAVTPLDSGHRNASSLAARQGR